MSSYRRWLNGVIPRESLGEVAAVAKPIEVIEEPPAEMCLACRGSKLLCGKSRCPIIVNVESLLKQGSSIDSVSIRGSSPPGVFVGRFGYPKVNIGPLVPPYFGDTEVLDSPEQWFGKTIDEIVDYRYSLVRGNVRANVLDAEEGNSVIESLQELVLASGPVDSELELYKKPRKILILSEDSHPFGPSAPMKRLTPDNVSSDRRLERAYYDKDLKASDAINQLYKNQVTVTKIQKALSVGSFGIRGFRRLVPTRWSITAVDTTISNNLLSEIRHHETINEFRVYTLRYLDNLYVAILMPEPWKFEWIEAWFPQTTWNQYGSAPAIMGDHEEHWGRSTYASVGGCYYSTRLAVSERLREERRQAASVILREIHPGYIMPVGVWNVRESIRKLFKINSQKFDDLHSALQYASHKLTIPLERWIEGSSLLKHAMYQKKLTNYY